MSEFTKNGRLLSTVSCIIRLGFNKRRVEVISKGDVVDTIPIFTNPDTGEKEIQTESPTGEVEFMSINYLYC